METVDERAIKLTKLIEKEGVEEVMKKVGGTKNKDGSYTFNNKKNVKKAGGGSICGRATGQGKGAARST
jgi:hypothetical protein